MSRRLVNIALLIASVAIALVATEFGVRFAYRDLTVTSPIESWFGERWMRDHLRLNTQGYREREYSRKKPAGVFRIAVIGDSFSVAMGVDEEDRFTNRLERALGLDGGRVEVLQFARAGHEIHHHLRTLQGVVLETAPDFVLLQFYVNDFDIEKHGFPRPLPMVPHPELHAWLYRHSALYSLLGQRWISWQVGLGLNRSYEEYMGSRYTDPDGVDSSRAMSQFDAFFALAELADVPVGVVLFPYLSPRLADDYPFAYLHDRVLALCEERGIPCVDLREVFAPYAERVDELIVTPYDHHASARAHELAAEALLERFGERWTQPR